MSKPLSLLPLIILCILLWEPILAQKQASPLAGKVVCLDAGHGGTAATDSYRAGPTGEREEWINLRVALLLQKMLEKKGATVVMTRTADDNIPLADRARLAIDKNADVFLSVHHNATADPAVNFPIIYFHGNATENAASVALGMDVAQALARHLYKSKTPVSLVSDHVIFATAGTKVLRDTYGIPGVIAEASFFTNAAEEKRLKKKKYNRREAQAYVEALEAFFSKPMPAVAPKNSAVHFPPFRAFQEAERMSEIAKAWQQDYQEGLELMALPDTAFWQQAYELFTRSARSFPDSYVAAQCHQNRAILLERLGKPQEALTEAIRAKEHYVPVTIK
ncbi:N-acetylmuramoyl-L-alanine amidase family protein [Pontibacter chinhatensis]|uniref:N-acetylmuramoyl-L-alanine amidase n=1 Tax=Pontibacter chinhatensis TaxID=1436961 RepID=A0A1I2R745_9BACT|nr:N-acetylmuramoyl-L-alanine amidase [Pontibacter chinhatensis]SFG36554.1 N-acetylmuramoyl-L-alanine amidase [Pontibacter chinhatensis]